MMARYLILFALVALPALITCGWWHSLLGTPSAPQRQSTSQKQPQSPQVSINNTHNIICSPENNATNSMNIQEVTLAISTHLRASLEQAQEQINNIKTKVTTQARLATTISIDAARDLAHKTQENWWKIASLCSLGGYAWVLWRNWKAQHWITSPLLWSAWHALQSYGSSGSASRKKVQRSLLLEISQRYLNTEAPLDYLFPLVQFGIAIEQEIERLNQLYTWRKRLNMSLMSRLVPIAGPTLEEISSQLEHAEQVRLLFRTYIAEQNLQAYLSNYADDLYEGRHITRRLHWVTIPEQGDTVRY